MTTKTEIALSCWAVSVACVWCVYWSKWAVTNLACTGRGNARSCARRWGGGSTHRPRGGPAGSGSQGRWCARRRRWGRRRSTCCRGKRWTAVRGKRCGAMACISLRLWCLPILHDDNKKPVRRQVEVQHFDYSLKWLYIQVILILMIPVLSGI